MNFSAKNYFFFRYNILNQSTSVYKKLFQLSDCSNCKNNEEPEEIEIDKDFIKNIIDEEAITSTNWSITSDKDDLDETQNALKEVNYLLITYL